MIHFWTVEVTCRTVWGSIETTTIGKTHPTLLPYNGVNSKNEHFISNPFINSFSVKNDCFFNFCRRFIFFVGTIQIFINKIKLLFVDYNQGKIFEWFFRAHRFHFKVDTRISALEFSKCISQFWSWVFDGKRSLFIQQFVNFNIFGMKSRIPF